MKASSIAFVTALLLTTAALAQIAPDATGSNPGVSVNSFEYKTTGILDTDVAPIPIDIWAKVYIPAGTTGKLPLVVFLHGNHATCGTFDGFGPARRDNRIDYTLNGTCPDRYVVIPNHLGYEYLAQPLATWGFVVVSINANRGVTAAPGVAGDRGLNLRRGRLVLRHLKELAILKSDPTSPLFGRIDFSHVGLMGHSRGGEGMRAAYEQFRAPGSPWPARIGTPVTFEGLFEIGPVDGQTGPAGNPNRLNADGLAWTVLLPNCDGDVFNLQGIKPFDRMLLITSETPARFKATYTVWGTNHDFYNTEWQFSDSPGCHGQKRLFPQLLGSADQRTISSAALLAFFRGNIGTGKNPAFNQNFDPQFQLPAVVTNVTRVDRGYTDSPSSTVTTVLDDFSNPPTATYTTQNVQFAITGVSQHDPSQRAAALSWNAAGPNVLFQTSAASALNLAAFKTLDFRVARQCGDPICRNSGPQYHTSTNFSVQLITGNGNAVSGSAQLEDFVSLTGPVGSLTRGAGPLPHPMMATARIPLSAFAGADLTNVRGVRFTFDGNNTDQIFIANVRASRVSGVAGPSPQTASLPSDDPPLSPDNTPDQNTVKSMKSVASSPALGNQGGVEITLTSNRAFLPGGEILVLQIGSGQFDISRLGDDGSTNQVTFTLTADQFASLQQGDSITVQFGDGGNGNTWNFGHVDKNMLNQ
jgi:hypothetical protein